MQITDETVLKDFRRSMTELKSNIDSLRKRFDSQIHQGWNYNPLFEKRLEIHRSVINLSKQQAELAEGLIALLEVISETDISKRRRMPLPPPPRPRRAHFLG